MPRLFKIAFLVSLFSIFYFLFSSLFSSHVYAQSEFTTRFTSSYTISEEGIASVIHSIELTNLLSNVYASEYALTIGSTQIKSVAAQISSGPVDTEIITRENNTTIKLKFTQPIIGKNQTLRFSVSYINLDIAAKSGRVLEVTIPKLANLADIDDYNLIIKVPDAFDTPTLMSPPTSSITQAGGFRVLRYTKNQILTRGVSILFGDHQVYNFTLRYTLNNPGFTPILTQIALPPDTPYQKLFYDSITPQPDNVTPDSDGNWLAHYTLKPGATHQVTAVGQAVLYLEPKLPASQPQDPSQFLTSSPYWQVDDPQILELGKKLQTPENIYNYLVDNLRYNYSRIDASTQRLGAKAALENPDQAICTEFTDLFVALARAAGIPSRGIDGFAYTTNPKLRPLSLRLDVLHAWPEYYDEAKQIWVPVDPTWGNTTGGLDYFSRWDLNHFTFTIHGDNPVEPYPPGAYKLASTEGKDVNVAFSSDEPQPALSFTGEFLPPKLTLPQLPLSLEFRFNNTGNVALVNPDITISAPGYNILSQTPQITLVPPFGHTTLNLKLKPKNFWPQSRSLTISINGQDFSYEIPFTPPNLTLLAFPLAGLILATILLFFTPKSRRLLVSWAKKRLPLHR